MDDCANKNSANKEMEFLCNNVDLLKFLLENDFRILFQSIKHFKTKSALKL